MSMTDPVADFLTRIRNAIQAGKDQVECPRSTLKLRIAEILKEEGYIDQVLSVDDRLQGTIAMTLRYDNGNAPAITGMKRVSRPGQRAYAGTKKLPRVRNGLGIAILSTSRGIMTDRTARKLGVGGEVLCEVW
jgi:small subunit ribosomal protein S8